VKRLTTAPGNVSALSYRAIFLLLQAMSSSLTLLFFFSSFFVAGLLALPHDRLPYNGLVAGDVISCLLGILKILHHNLESREPVTTFTSTDHLLLYEGSRDS